MRSQLSAVLVTGAAVAVVMSAGSAFAQVADGAWEIVAKRSAGTTAQVAATDDDYAVRVQVICGEFVEENDAEKGSAVLLDSNHPDEVGLTKKQAKVKQQRTGNAMRARLRTGSGTAQTTNILICDKARAEAKVKTKKSPNTGSFEAFMKKCGCLVSESDDCDIFEDQMEQLGKDCENNKTIVNSFKDGRINKIRIKGKGDAFPLE